MVRLQLCLFICLFFLFASNASADAHTITSSMERNPDDLDVHFFGPTDATGESPFHVYDSNEIEGLGGVALNVDLDVDDTLNVKAPPKSEVKSYQLLGFDSTELEALVSSEEAEKTPTKAAPVTPRTVSKKKIGKETGSDQLLGFDKAQLDALVKDIKPSPPVEPSSAKPKPVQKKQRQTKKLAKTVSTPALPSTSIGMPTGNTNGTYYPLGVNIAKLAASKGLLIDVKSSSGSLDNIRRMASDENAGLAIVQSDVVDYLLSDASQSNQAIINNLRSVFSLYNEEIHLLASKDIKTLLDLDKKRVIVGEIGSGTPITASRVFDKAGIDVEQITGIPPEKALKQLILGGVDALFFIGGKPLIYINGLLEMKNNERLREYTEGIHLIPLDDERLYDTYTRTEIAPTDYQSKNGLYRLTETVVPTIAVQAILVSYNFSTKDSQYHKMRCGQLNQLNRIVRENLEIMASNDDGKYHPKWAQVDLDQTTKLAKNQCIDDSKPKETDLKAIDCYLQTGNNCK